MNISSNPTNFVARKGLRSHEGSHMKNTILAGALLAGAVVLVPSAAPAHTPAINATCDGVVLKATSYDGSKKNTWTVTVAGATSSGTFGESFNRTFPVEQAGAITEWSATIKAENGDFKQSESGKVGPCGEKPPVLPPKPNDEIKVTESEVVKCEDKTVTKKITTTTTPYVKNEKGDGWILGTPVVTSKEEYRPATPTECPPIKPVDKVVVTDSEKVKCEDKTVVKTIVTTTTPFVLNEKGDAYIPGTPVVTTKDEIRPATTTECPATPPTEPPTKEEPPVPPVTPPAKPPVKDEPKGKIGTPIHEEKSKAEKRVVSTPTGVLPNTGAEMDYRQGSIFGGLLTLAGIIAVAGPSVARKVRRN